jgi:glycosylphosphatidylinositol transamidase (GPIT) subunit GPI8
LGLLAASACTPKYAVLVSTNQVAMDNVAYHSEWWYDLVLQYKMLRQSGFRDDSILVLYGDGHDFATSRPEYDSTTLFGHPITTSPVSKAAVHEAFQRVDARMRKRGYLYVWWMGHGGGAGPGQCDLSMMISNTGEVVTDDELKSDIDQVRRFRKRSVSIMTCHSGGLLDEFAAADRTVVLASSTCAESSYDAPASCNGAVQAEFNLTQPAALSRRNLCGGAIAADFTGNGWVSLAEAQQWNAGAMSTSTPQMGDAAALAATLEPARPKP